MCSFLPCWHFLLPASRWHQQKASQTWLVRCSLPPLRTISWACWQCVWCCCSSWGCCAAASPSVSRRSWRTGKEGCQGQEGGGGEGGDPMSSLFPSPFHKRGVEKLAALLSAPHPPRALAMARWRGQARLKMCRYSCYWQQPCWDLILLSSHCPCFLTAVLLHRHLLLCDRTCLLWTFGPFCVRAREYVCAVRSVCVPASLRHCFSPFSFLHVRVFVSLHLQFMYLLLMLLYWMLWFYVCLGFVVLPCGLPKRWGSGSRFSLLNYRNTFVWLWLISIYFSYTWWLVYMWY